MIRQSSPGQPCSSSWSSWGPGSSLPAAPPEVIVASSGEALRGLSQTIIDCARSSLFALPLLLPDERLEAVARGLGWSGRMAFLPRFTAAAVRAAVEDCR